MQCSIAAITLLLGIASLLFVSTANPENISLDENDVKKSFDSLAVGAHKQRKHGSSRQGDTLRPIGKADAAAASKQWARWFDNPNPSKAILVDGGSYDCTPPSGGAEAMVQLAMALSQALIKEGGPSAHEAVHITHLTRPNFRVNYTQHYVSLYGADLVYRSKSTQSMKPGDILIVPENTNCVRMPAGAILFVYQLSTTMVCSPPSARFIVHNYYLRQSNVLSLPEQRVVVPYLSPSIVALAKSVAGLRDDGSIDIKQSKSAEGKKNIVLIDNDVPPYLVAVINEAAVFAGGSAVVIENMSKETVLTYYQKAKVIIDWCMRGSERCPLEAGLFGNVLITNPCQTGSNHRDFPIPARYIAPKMPPKDEGAKKKLTTYLKNTFVDIFERYWEIVPEFTEYRASILKNNATRMTTDARNFLNTVYLDGSKFPGGCRGC